MNQTAILIAQALLTYGPGVARALVDIFSKKEPTLDDWNRVFALAEKSYAAYVAKPTSALPSA